MKTALRLLLAGAACFTLATAAEARPLTAKDLATLDRISDPRVSPDGRYVVYSQRTVNYDANKATTSLWLVDLTAKTPAPRRLGASDGGANSARWAPDSKTVYFLSSRGGSSQVWRTEVGVETAGQVTKLPFDVGAFRVSPDGGRLAVSLAVFPDCDTLQCTADRQAADAARKSTGQVHDKLFVRHWDAWADGTRNHLYVLNLDEKRLATAGEPVAVMKGFDGDAPSKPFGDDGEFTFTPDSQSVVFAARLAGKSEPWSTNFDLYTTPADGSAAPVNTTKANEAWDTGAAYSPDGKQVAYRAMKRPTFEADRYRIMIRDVATGATRELAPAWDRSADAIAWAPDGKTIYAVAGDVGQTRLFAVDVKTAKVSPLTGPGHVGAFDVSARGIVYSQDTLASPAQLYSIGFKPGAKPVKLTDANADKLAGVEMGQAEQFTFTGWNNETVHAYLVKPIGFDPAKTYPVAFLIHGGPQGSFGNGFSYRWNPQTYASAGYAVVMVDFHGSTGYGQAFTDSISQHWGDRPLEDLQKGWAHALKTYSFLDGDRACALGASYGGYMVNWIAGNWNEPWKCLVNHDGVFDSRAMAYGTEELWFTEWENGGKAWDATANIEKFNPVNHVQNWKKPMLVVQGGLDFRIPTEQGLSTFTALQRQGVDSRLLYFPNENHWVLRPQNSVQWHGEVLGWLNKYTAAK
ncbi:alpha/beta hydrolase family protein [Caulobacter mirabilis]|uniref:Peptidase S9 n=1 Tax=Caulobacter mirabilis TaxID=69666 RepID=A0A2D2AWU3_9CAUL|nr:S9 family peptidase [Caulobacter mirabilis]ATQ42478.1 peptidase S9 [Caulobacter mirabilis]